MKERIKLIKQISKQRIWKKKTSENKKNDLIYYISSNINTECYWPQFSNQNNRMEVGLKSKMPPCFVHKKHISLTKTNIVFE
jgi:hypothetical protein